jgi:hypothetical protein
MEQRYYTVTAPAPWNKSGTARLTARIDDYEVRLSAGSQRMRLNKTQAWGLWVALGNALQDAYGPVPQWAANQRAVADEGAETREVAR